MKKLMMLIIISIILLGFNTVFADLYAYPDMQNPLFYIDFPDTWDTVAQEEMIYSKPNDASVLMIVWSIDGKTIDEASVDVNSVLSDIFTDVQLGKPKKMTSNEVPFRKFDGKGKLDSSIVDISLSVFAPDKSKSFMFLYYLRSRS